MAIVLRFRRIKEIKKLQQQYQNTALIRRVINRRYDIGLLTTEEARCLIEMYSYHQAL